jgi:hypothetical protein
MNLLYFNSLFLSKNKEFTSLFFDKNKETFQFNCCILV